MVKKKNEVDKIVDTNAPAVKPGALMTVEDKQALAAIRMAGGTDQSGSSLNLPILRLEHTTDFESEPNPLKGQFTLTRRNQLGEWDKSELGEFIVAQFLIQRYTLSMTKTGGKVKYSSKEFDNPNDRVLLFKSEGKGEDRKSEPYREDTPSNLAKDFLIREMVGGKEKVKSELKLLYVLYLKLEGSEEIIKWKTNVSGTVGWSKYQKSGVLPFAVITKVTREEAVSGSNKYYRPIFRATEPLKDFGKVLSEQTSLREMLTVGNVDNSIQVDEEGA